jgi:hypothetical protein
MANRIIGVALPDSVVSGKTFSVTVQYTADADGELGITYTGQFDGTPDSMPIDSSRSSVTFDMTIVRYGTEPACRVEFRFGNLKIKIVTVM